MRTSLKAQGNFQLVQSDCMSRVLIFHTNKTSSTCDTARFGPSYIPTRYGKEISQIFTMFRFLVSKVPSGNAQAQIIFDWRKIEKWKLSVPIQDHVLCNVENNSISLLPGWIENMGNVYRCLIFIVVSITLKTLKWRGLGEDHLV